MSSFRRILGPYSVLQQSGPAPLPVVQLRFGEVRGGQLAIYAKDNLGKHPSGEFPPMFDQVALLETEIVGLVQGAEISLKLQQVTTLTGPMVYRFADDEPYENIDIRCRCMRGGLRAPLNNTAESQYAPANGFQAFLTIMIIPRYIKPEKGGFGV